MPAHARLPRNSRPRQPAGIEVYPRRRFRVTRMFVPVQEPPWRAIRAFPIRSGRPWFICTMSRAAFCPMTRSTFRLKRERPRVFKSLRSAQHGFTVTAPADPWRASSLPFALMMAPCSNTFPMWSFRSPARASASPPPFRSVRTPDSSAGNRWRPADRQWRRVRVRFL